MSTVFGQINPSYMEAYKTRYGNDEVVTPVTEAYFGKSKELLKIEKILDTFLKDVYADFTDAFDATGFANAFDKMLIHPEQRKRIKDVESLFMKQFGFGEFNLLFVHIPLHEFYSSPNAFTPTVGVIRKIAADMTHFAPLSQGSGGYYDKTHSYSCCVFVMPEILDCRFTAGELLAIILHEIGHNFQCTPMTNIGMFMPYLNVYSQIQSLVTSGAIKKNQNVSAMIGNILTTAVVSSFSAEIFNVIGRVIQEILRTLGGALNPINNLLSIASKCLNLYRSIRDRIIPFENYQMIAYALFNISQMSFLDMVEAMCGYSGEVFADSFAATYGYGPEMNGALAKIDNTFTIKYNVLMDPNKNPLAPIWEASACYMEIVRVIFSMDPHPSTQRRLLNTMDKLEKDLESGQLPPKMKKAALRDLKESRKAYEAFLHASVEDKKLSILTSFRVINDEMFGGKLEIKHLINIVLNAGNTQA